MEVLAHFNVFPIEQMQLAKPVSHVWEYIGLERPKIVIFIIIYSFLSRYRIKRDADKMFPSEPSFVFRFPGRSAA